MIDVLKEQQRAAIYLAQLEYEGGGSASCAEGHADCAMTPAGRCGNEAWSLIPEDAREYLETWAEQKLGERRQAREDRKEARQRNLEIRGHVPAPTIDQDVERNARARDKHLKDKGDKERLQEALGKVSDALSALDLSDLETACQAAADLIEEVDPDSESPTLCAEQIAAIPSDLQAELDNAESHLEDLS